MRGILMLAGAFAFGVAAHVAASPSDLGQVRLQLSGTNTFLQVLGDEDAEWRFQTSDNLLVWTDAPKLGTVYSGDANPPSVPASGAGDSVRFYRAVKTTGLYDPKVLRTISLTFTQSNWQTLLANGRTKGTNTLGNLFLDNGTTNYGVGVRYKGNSSYTGMGGAPTKKSLNIDLDFTNSASRLMGYKTINLNNAYTDETIMREALYFNVMGLYTVCPKACLAKLFINGAYWGVYSCAQQPNGELIDEWFPSHDGDRWRAPNMGGAATGGRPGGGGGGFGGGGSAFYYLGTNIASYKSNYELKSDNSTNAWERLMNATYVLNNTPTNQLRDKVEDVLAVDRWLWFLALENIFTDEDSYYFKGADYCFYYEPESARFHPVEYDGNESLVSADSSLSPVQGAMDANRPLLYRLLSVPELRQRYLAHLRTVLAETVNPPVMTSLINQYSALSAADIAADTKKGYTLTAYTNDLKALNSFVTNRYKFLTNHAELRPVPPNIVAVNPPVVAPTPLETPYLTADVRPEGANGVSSVWLYHRGKSYGRFAAVQMFDDGAHGDGSANDGIYGATTTNYPAGTKVRYYVEARSANSAKAASFSPARAEQETYSYRVALAIATNSPVAINELMASNKKTVVDPQGEYDDWIELRNLTGQEVDLSGCYLSEEAAHPRKWRFPDGTKIPANGYLLIWADEDGKDTPVLHTNFKLAAAGSELFLIDTDAHNNALLDSVAYGDQTSDRSYGRLPGDTAVFGEMNPTPGVENK